jgi:hypothetical protein
MGEVTEKIYCCDRDNNDNALAAAIQLPMPGILFCQQKNLD